MASIVHTSIASDTPPSTHGSAAINRKTGDVAVVFSEGAVGSRNVKVAIYKRRGAREWEKYGTLVIGDRTAAATPTGGAAECSHPWITAMGNGFAVAFQRKDTAIAVTAMTVGGMQIELVKLVPGGGSLGYRAIGSSTTGKGFVLDNTIIAGDLGGTPRLLRWRGNIAAIVYGHQLTYALDAGTRERTWALRAAYLDFSPDGKPTLIVNGNRTGGSVSGEPADGGYAAGPTQTYLVTGINLDDLDATPIFAAGGGLGATIDPRGNFMVAYEVRDGGSGAGGIVVRTYHGPYRDTGLDAAAIYINTASFGAGAAPNAARRPALAFPNPFDYPVAISAGDLYPPVVLGYAGQVPGTDDSSQVLGRLIEFPEHGATATITNMTIPTNTGYDAVQKGAGFPSAVACPFLNAVTFKENLVAGGVNGGYLIRQVYADDNRHVLLPNLAIKPDRPVMVAETLLDETDVAVMTYEGQDLTGQSDQWVGCEISIF